MNALNPVRTIGSQIVEALELHGTRQRPGGAGADRELLESVGIPASRARALPARALRRHAPAGGDRDGALLQPEGPDRRRADDRAGRDGAGADPRTARQPLPRLRARADPRHARPASRRAALLPRRPSCTRARSSRAGRSTTCTTPRGTPYTRLLFAATPDLAARNGEIASIPGAPPRLDRPLTGCPFRPRCDSAFEPCATERPLLKDVGPEHAAACHLNDRAPASGMSALLEIDDLVVRYPLPRGLFGVACAPRGAVSVRAVDGVTLSLQAGELVALVGESGCGKTTTAQAVLRLVDPVSGAIRYEGRDITPLGPRALRPLRREIQIVYQDPYESLDPRLRVRAAVEEPLAHPRARRLEGGARWSGSARRSQRVELSPPELFLDRYPHELSGGQRQRVAIAAALVLGPAPARRRRAGLDARRLRSRGSAQAPRRAAEERARDPHDHARPLHGGAVRGPDRGHVSRPDRRARARRRGRREPAASVHEGAPLGRARGATRASGSVCRSCAARHRTRFGSRAGCRFHPRCPLAVDECSSTDPALARPAGASRGHEAACILLASAG